MDFEKLLKTSGHSDEKVRSEFNSLPLTYRNHIKERMWLIAGGAANPQFQSGLADWAGDQLKTNPLPRQLLSESVQFFLRLRSSGHTTGNMLQLFNFRELDFLEAKRKVAEGEFSFVYVPVGTRQATCRSSLILGS